MVDPVAQGPRAASVHRPVVPAMSSVGRAMDAVCRISVFQISVFRIAVAVVENPPAWPDEVKASPRACLAGSWRGTALREWRGWTALPTSHNPKSCGSLRSRVEWVCAAHSKQVVALDAAMCQTPS